VKSVGLAPAMVTPLIASEALPVLLSVAARAAAVAPTVVLGKAAGAVSEAIGAAAAVPVPVRLAVWVEVPEVPSPIGLREVTVTVWPPEALSVIESVAAKLVAEPGVKVT